MGVANITASVTDGSRTIERTCVVSVLHADASFLTYNVTDQGWAHISRSDVTQVTNLTEGVEESIPTAIASIDDVVYGFDEENNFFSLDTETFPTHSHCRCRDGYDPCQAASGSGCDRVCGT